MAARRRLLAGLPVTETRVSAGGSSTAVLEAGGGPPLVLLHGGIECGGVCPSERNAERFDRWAFFDFDDARRRDGDWLAAFSEYTRSQATVPPVKRTMRRLIASCTKQVADAELRRIAVPPSSSGADTTASCRSRSLRGRARGSGGRCASSSALATCRTSSGPTTFWR